MSTNNKIKVIGYQWVSVGGTKACEVCRALHGRIFYVDPGPGQYSVADMPKAPMHPNCRCTCKELIEFQIPEPESTLVSYEENQEQEDGASSDYFDSFADIPNLEKGTLHIDPWVRLRWRKGDPLSGPVHENFCGQYWSHGQDTRNPGYKSDPSIKPSNDMDAACAEHDFCYDQSSELPCDHGLVNGLSALDEDPRKWHNPPTENKIGEAARYRG